MLLDLIKTFVKQHPWLVFTNTLFMVFVPLNEVLLPYLYGKMITDIYTPQAVITLIVLAVVLVIAQTGMVLRDKMNEKFIPRFEAFIKTEMVSRILDKHNTAFDTLTTGDIIYRLSKIPDIIITWFQWMNDYIVPYIIVFIIAIVYFVRYDLVIAAIFVVFLCILTLVFVHAPKSCSAVARENDSMFSKLHEKIEDIIHNMSSIYSSNTKDHEIKELDEHAHKYSRVFSDTIACTRKYKTLMIPFVTMLVVLFVMRSRTLENKNFASMFMVLTYMLASVIWIIDIMRLSVFDVGCFQNINGMLEFGNNTKRQIFNMRAPKDSIGLYNISFNYEGKELFKNTSVQFAKNKTTAIIGPIGTGKSSILKLLLAFYVPSAGDCYIDGKWYSELNVKEIREKIGYIPQNPILFNNTVLYNILYGNPGASRKDALEIVKMAGFDETFLDKNVGKNGMNLSGGQRQLVWCLRVLLKNPEYLLMDEPTASMDDNTKDILLHIIATLVKGRTVILVSHDHELTNIADYKVHL